jgi:hypothetical protein
MGAEFIGLIVWFAVTVGGGLILFGNEEKGR